MKIRWYGHACFELNSSRGVRIVADPFDAKVGYEVPDIEANIVTLSHDHYDHNNLSAVKGEYVLVKDTGDYNIEEITIQGFSTYHDHEMGVKRGKNIVFKYIIDKLTIVHLGDLGHLLDQDILQNLEDIDVLLIPTGGTFTIDSSEAFELVTTISPKIIIPMHYKTEKINFNIEPVYNFTKYFDNVVYLDSNELNISDGQLKKNNQVIVFSI